MIVNSSSDELQVKFHGGGNHSERKRAIIAPYYEEIDVKDFQLSLLQANYHVKFLTLEHRDIMGSFLSLGIKREKLGDIYSEGGLIQLIVAGDISPFVLIHLTGIKRAKLTFAEKPLSDLVEKELAWMETDKTVSSLRLDNLVKEIYNISRNDAADAIRKKLVKVNFKVIEDGKFAVFENDLISLRGKGRSKLIKINGRSKKDKLKITIAKLRD